MAARVVARIAAGPDVDVKVQRGGLGEFSVTLDGEKIVDTNRLWYPNPGRVVERVRERLAAGARQTPR
jgi:hypothetical protein